MRNWIVGCATGAVLVAGLTTPGLMAQDKGKPGVAAKGKEVFDQCSVCHNADSTETKVGPGLKGLFKMDKLVNGKPVTEANVRELINAGGNGMPAYADQLSDQDKNDLIAYLKTL
jgi:cytochrome c